MKKRLILSAALLLTAATTTAQTDYTGNIDNPSFETNGLAGWKNKGYQVQTNDATTAQGWTKSGNAYAEMWSSGALPDGRLSQVVTGLPDGYYLLTTDAHAMKEGVSAISGVSLFAGRNQAFVKKGGSYRVGAIATGGRLEIGIGNTATNATWIAADNFRLTAVDTTAQVYKRYKYTTTVAARAIQNELKSKGYHQPEALRTAIADASSAGDDKAAIVAVVARLEAAISECQAAMPHYDKLRSAIISARNNALRTAYEGNATFRRAIATAGSTLAAEGDVEKVDAATATLRKAMDDYLANRPSEWVTIQNGKLWKTDTGAAVQAHAPGFVRVGDLWYMVGEDRSRQWNPDVNLYSSLDLVNWKFEKKIIQNGVTSPELGSSRMIERAKLMYNEQTSKFVVWCHWEAGNYGASEAACFTCDSVNGAYKLEWSGRPLGVKSRDCNIFIDNDGTAYFISTTEENRHLGLFRLSDDYLSATSHTQLFAWQSREAPAIVRIGPRYFMFSSACSGWDPNQCKLSHTTDLRSGWSGLANVGNANSFDTQAAAILEVKGTKATTYLYVGDRWQDPGLPESKTIVFPVSFSGTACTFKYHERFDINFVTGEWRETPTEKVFADKRGWKVAGCSSEETGSENSPAKNAIDGRSDTKWHTKYSGTAAAAPHHIAIDMGKPIRIKGFLATPRMDGQTNGLIRKYRFEVSDDGQAWATAASGSWLPYCTEVLFGAPVQCRYIKLVGEEGSYASLAELDAILADETPTAIAPTPAEHGGRQESGHSYFALDGRRINEPSEGLFIEQVTYADGTRRNIKRLR